MSVECKVTVLRTVGNLSIGLVQHRIGGRVVTLRSPFTANQYAEGGGEYLVKPQPINLGNPVF